MATTTDHLPDLPPTFASTRDSLHALACFVIAPARRADSGGIGLQPVGDGIGTPPLGDGSRVVAQRDRVGRIPGEMATISTLRAAADHVGVRLSADPGVGHDLPPYAPDAPLAVDPLASLALGRWYRFGRRILERTVELLPAGAEVSEAQLWPEHFDLAVTIAFGTSLGVNVGFSPGDRFSSDPYVYVGPHSMQALDEPYWNAPFGATLQYPDLIGPAPEDAVVAFISTGLGILQNRRGPR